jgi:hypothetical protein
MAGQPRRRAKAVIEELRKQGILPEGEESIPDAIPAGAGNAPVRAREPRKDFPVGPASRSFADQLQAQQLGLLAVQLRPGIVVAIERIRPSWCAGYLEEYTIDEEGLSELRDYIRDEYGGQVYRLTVQFPDGRPAYISKIPISGRPRDRGRPLSRDTLEGNPAQVPAVQSQAAPAPGQGDSMLWSKLLDITIGNNEKVLQAIERMGANQTASTRHLIETIVEARERGDERRGFLGSLQEVVDATSALDQVKDMLGAGRKAGDELDTANTQDLARLAARDFFRTVVAAKAQDIASKSSRKAPEGQEAPAPRPSPGPPTNGGRRRSSGVVDAIPVTGVPPGSHGK